MAYFASVLLLFSVMLLRLFYHVPTTTKYLHSNCQHSDRKVWWSYSYIFPSPLLQHSQYLSVQDLKCDNIRISQVISRIWKISDLGMTSPAHMTNVKTVFRFGLFTLVLKIYSDLDFQPIMCEVWYLGLQSNALPLNLIDYKNICVHYRNILESSNSANVLKNLPISHTGNLIYWENEIMITKLRWKCKSFELKLQT